MIPAIVAVVCLALAGWLTWDTVRHPGRPRWWSVAAIAVNLVAAGLGIGRVTGWL